jgi:signal transduction histidine kinase
MRRKKMKKLFSGFLVICFILSSVGAAFSAEKAGTAAEAVAMVKKAIVYIKAHGREKAFAEFSNPKGPFIDRDLYVTVYDMKGVCLAHGFNPKMVGKNMIDLKDPDGKAFVKERNEMAKTKDKFWVDYKYVNPLTKQIEQKSQYVEKLGDILVNCGIYK